MPIGYRAAIKNGTPLVEVEIIAPGGIQIFGWGGGLPGEKLQLDIKTATEQQQRGNVRIIRDDPKRQPAKPAVEKKEDSTDA